MAQQSFTVSAALLAYSVWSGDVRKAGVSFNSGQSIWIGIRWIFPWLWSSELLQEHSKGLEKYTEVGKTHRRCQWEGRGADDLRAVGGHLPCKLGNGFNGQELQTFSVKEKICKIMETWKKKKARAAGDAKCVALFMLAVGALHFPLDRMYC